MHHAQETDTRLPLDVVCVLRAITAIPIMIANHSSHEPQTVALRLHHPHRPEAAHLHRHRRDHHLGAQGNPAYRDPRRFPSCARSGSSRIV